MNTEHLSHSAPDKESRPTLFSLSINIALLLATLLVCYGICELTFAIWEARLLRTMGVFIPVDPRFDGSAWEVDPTQASRFMWFPDGNSIVHIRSNNSKLMYELRPNAEISQIIKINSHGFRDYEFTKEKPLNTYRIIVVGDSVTFGWRQKLEDTYPKIIEKKLNENYSLKMNFEVLNFGIGGYNAEQEAELIKTKVLNFNPDLIIIGFCPNDGQIGFDGGLWWHFFRGKSRTLSFLKLLNIYRKCQKDHLYILRSAYTEIADVITQSQIPVLVCILPMLQGDQLWYPQDFLDLLVQLNLPYFNLVEHFKGRDISQLMLDTVHLTVEGHKLVGELIADYLIENRIIPLE